MVETVRQKPKSYQNSLVNTFFVRKQSFGDGRSCRGRQKYWCTPFTRQEEWQHMQGKRKIETGLRGEELFPRGPEWRAFIALPKGNTVA